MALKAFGLDAAGTDERWRRGTALWTVELALLLREQGLDVTMLTECAGVNAQHAQLPFYSSTLDRDEERINLLFQSARASGIRVEQRKCLDAELVARVAGPGPPTLAIALVDRDCLANGSPGGQFWGHYIVVCDFDGELVALQDPAHDGLQWLSAQVFHAARKARGTDWDILLVTGPTP